MIKLIDAYGVSEETLINNLNKELFIEHVSLGSRISEFRLFNYLIDKYNKNGVFTQRILTILKNNNFPQPFIELVPLDIITNKLWDVLPNEIKLDYFEKNTSLSNDIDQLIKIIHDVPEKSRQKKLKKMSSNIKEHPKLFIYLHPIDQAAQLLNKDLATITSIWPVLNITTKLFYLFALAEHGASIDFIEEFQEENPLVRAVLKIIWVKNYEFLWN